MIDARYCFSFGPPLVQRHSDRRYGTSSGTTLSRPNDQVPYSPEVSKSPESSICQNNRYITNPEMEARYYNSSRPCNSHALSCMYASPVSCQVQISLLFLSMRRKSSLAHVPKPRIHRTRHLQNLGSHVEDRFASVQPPSTQLAFPAVLVLPACVALTPLLPSKKLESKRKHSSLSQPRTSCNAYFQGGCKNRWLSHTHQPG